MHLCTDLKSSENVQLWLSTCTKSRNQVACMTCVFLGENKHFGFWVHPGHTNSIFLLPPRADRHREEVWSFPRGSHSVAIISLWNSQVPHGTFKKVSNPACIWGTRLYRHYGEKSYRKLRVMCFFVFPERNIINFYNNYQRAKTIFLTFC